MERRMMGALGWLAGCALVVALALAADAQQPNPAPGSPLPRVEPLDLQQRLENLERQNDTLTRQLLELQGRDAHGSEASALSPQTMEEKKAAAKAAEKSKDAQKEGAAKTDGGDKTYVVGENMKLEPVWKNGLQFQTPDKAFKFAVGGTVQFDMGWFRAPQSIVNSVGAMNNFVDPGLALSDGMDFRRARLRFNGTYYETAEFFAQYDFAQSLDLRRRTIGVTNPTAPTAYDFNPGEPTAFNEVWVGLSQIPLLGALRIGHHREALNFITATADRNQVWMERGLLFDAFNGDFNFGSGITLDRTYFDGRAYTWLGFFENNSRTFSAVGDGNYAYDARVTALPMWDEERELWVHVGVDYSYRNLTLNQVRYRARPMIRVGNNFQVNNILDTGTFFSRDAEQIVNLEFASACGPWTFSAEAACSWVTNAFTGGLPLATGKLPAGAVSRGTFFAPAAYTELLYFLTPDHREYRKERPGHDRVVPRENFFFVESDHGPIWNRGAWEVGVRYDYLDLTSNGINGGIGQAVTFGVNWYLNPNTRFQVNYSVMHRAFAPSDAAARVTGDLQVLGFRANMDF
jgi:phosphate-selective porin OprO/OprP